METNVLAENAFLRGEAAFQRGRYHDTVQALTECISTEKTPACKDLEANAYNLLGMLFSFVGYETVALDNYLSAMEAARRSKNVQGEVISLLNIGILYQGVENYRKAMTYYKRGYDIAMGNHASPDMFLLLICLIQEAQLLCRMGRYHDAKRMKREIDSYYQLIATEEVLLSKYILEVQLEQHFGSETVANTLIANVIEFLEVDGQYLEQIDFYVDFCTFLLKHEKKDASKRMIDLLKEKLAATEFLHLQMKMEELEIQYQKQYGNQSNYLQACVFYMEIQSEYDRTLKDFKKQNLNNIENLQELERQKLEFELRSKCDLATGLLNKDTFRYEVESYLAERNRDVMDALIIVDIDDFKLVNDSFGHLMGDEVIQQLTELLKKSFTEDELCGRFGGDEFVVFVKNIDDMGEVERRIEKYRENFAKIAFGKNGDIHNTVSVGVSYNCGINASYEAMFSCADEALMKSKEYGKNRVAFYEIKRGLLKYV